MLIAFDEVERKPNFDLWLSRVGCPVHSYTKAEKSTFLQGHQNGHPTLFLQGHVTASKLVLLLRYVLKVLKTWQICEHVSRLCELSFRLLVFSFRRCMLRYFVFSALDFGELKRFHESFYRNLRKLSWYVNGDDEESPWLWEQL